MRGRKCTKPLIIGNNRVLLSKKLNKFKYFVRYNEARHLNESLIVRYEVAVAPHGAQVLWARTTHIGCARIEYFIDEEEKKKRLTTICNYGPGGNIAGSAVFLIGEPCSRCGRKICCDEEYDALCMDNNSGERFIHAKSLLVIFIIFIQSL